jgi:hypothetical protein
MRSLLCPSALLVYSLHFMSKQFQFKLVLLGMLQSIDATNLMHIAIHR